MRHAIRDILYTFIHIHTYRYTHTRVQAYKLRSVHPRHPSKVHCVYTRYSMSIALLPHYAYIHSTSHT